MTFEAGESAPIEYRHSTTSQVVRFIFSILFTVAGIVSICSVMFGIGWDVYLDWLGEQSYRNPHPETAIALTFGMGFGIPVGLLLLLYSLTPAFTRIDATGIEVLHMGRRRSFAWHEIADIYERHNLDNKWSRYKHYMLKGRLHSGKSFHLPGLTDMDFGVEELRQIHDALIKRLRGGGPLGDPR